MIFTLQRVHFMPKLIEPGIVYLSEEFDIAIHLCACGCGSKIRTPLGPTEWSVKEINGKPSLSPSIGNWQQLCQSHYWIDGGEIKWASKWSTAAIEAGRAREEERRKSYYDSIATEKQGFLRRVWNWIKRLFE